MEIGLILFILIGLAAGWMAGTSGEGRRVWRRRRHRCRRNWRVNWRVAVSTVRCVCRKWAARESHRRDHWRYYLVICVTPDQKGVRRKNYESSTAFRHRICARNYCGDCHSRHAKVIKLHCCDLPDRGWRDWDSGTENLSLASCGCAPRR